ncbi:MAG: hypothetical protein Q9172_004976 [Xanthocarpia lactea]
MASVSTLTSIVLAVWGEVVKWLWNLGLPSQAASANQDLLVRLAVLLEVQAENIEEMCEVLQLASPTLGAPKDFKVVPTWESNTPIDSTAFYVTAVELLDRLSTSSLYQRLGEIRFDFKDYNLEMDFIPSTPEDSKLNTQLIIWTLLYLAFSMAARKQYTAVSAGLLWRGESVATVRIANAAGPSLSIGALNNNFLGSSTLTSSNNSTLQAGKERLEIEVWHDPDQPIAKDDLLLTALRAMGDALEAGVQNFASQQKTMGIHRVTWLLLSENDADGNPLFKYRYSVFAIHRLVELMIKDSLWCGSLIVVRNLGRQVAKGGLNYWPEDARAATNQQ